MTDTNYTQPIEELATQAQPRKRMSLTKKIGLGLAGLVTAGALTFGGILVIHDYNYNRIDKIPYSKRTAEEEVFHENSTHYCSVNYGEGKFEILIRLHPELRHTKIKELEKQGYVKEAVLFEEARINKMTVKAYQEYNKEALELLNKDADYAEWPALKAKYQALK